MELSPITIKTVSVKLRPSSKKVGGVSPFLLFDLTETCLSAVDGQTCKAHG
jgi:hypothetical protein